MKATAEIIASIITLALIFLGLPSQILKIYKKQSMDGISLFFFSVSFLTWMSWCFYGYISNSLFMAIAQGLGGVMTAIILIQFFLYRKNPNLDQLKNDAWAEEIKNNFKKYLDENKNKDDQDISDDENRWEDEGGAMKKIIERINLCARFSLLRNCNFSD